MIRLDAVLNDAVQDYIDFKPDTTKSLQEIAGYSNKPEINTVLNNIHLKLREEILKDKEAKKPKAYKILDIGCGPGLFLKDFLGTAELNGIDLSKAMVALAKSQLPEASIDEGDFLKHHFQEKFDAIYSIGVLIYVAKSQLKTFFSKVNALLNEKGIVFISYPHAYRPSDLGYPDFTYVHYASEYLETLVRKEFEIIYHMHVDGTRKVIGYDHSAIPNPNGYEGRTYQNSSMLILRKL
jgi:predicted TPR repeat methyltransferase